jgi:hypothetical protein
MLQEDLHAGLAILQQCVTSDWSCSVLVTWLLVADDLLIADRMSDANLACSVRLPRRLFCTYIAAFGPP